MDYKNNKELLISKSKVTSSGVHMIYKKSPNLVKGELDLVVQQDKKAEGQKENPFDLPKDTINSEELAKMVRAQMGSPNIDLSKSVTELEDSFENEGATIKLYIYKPEGKTDKALPAVIYFHGGGFIGGKPEVVANACKGIAEKTPAVVINVEYRLAPEFPAPAAIKDAYEAVKWVVENGDKLGIDKRKIIVGGDSAGGSLAMAATILDCEHETNLIGMQALIYPAVCLEPAKSDEFSWPVDKYNPTPGYRKQLKEELNNFSKNMPLIMDVYVKKHDPNNAVFSPVLSDDFSKMPPTFMAIAEFDYLRPSEEKYVTKLAEANVSVQTIFYEGIGHAFIDKYGIYPQAQDCINEISLMINKVFN
ncbi:alpha/beta hydrolase [Oceanobacillus oncorhynchi subsp. oncorhynchi]|uniref:alpha/beta hydrolase n=1 Tax=Oceanobacillus oncorhynchi TaxID=545501 RepID=UPI00363CCFA6